MRKTKEVGEFVKSFHKVINLVGPVPNSPITVENKEDKVLADWARHACILLTDQAEEITKQKETIYKMTYQRGKP